jgi:hypothetical protein
MTSFSSQLKSLILFLPHTATYWFYMIKDRIKYGKPRGPKCGRFGCWTLVWEDPETGELSPDHVSFETARAIAPSLDCFIYKAKCGCTKYWWGAYKYYLCPCPNDCGGLNEV